VPFDRAHWASVAQDRWASGLSTPYSNDPTQWVFSGHPAEALEPLQVAVVRLLGYRWPRQTGMHVEGCLPVGDDGLKPLVVPDGIPALSAITGEDSASQRLGAVLAAAYESDWTADKLNQLLAAVGYSGRSLEDWLRNGFFEQHCALFANRPFIWHVWDGRR